MERVAAGLWHTICISAEGHAYAFGGNQFGQLGTEGDQDEVHPRPGYSVELSLNYLSHWQCDAEAMPKCFPTFHVITNDSHLPTAFSFMYHLYISTHVPIKKIY